MKNVMTTVMFFVLVGTLAGCGPSAQEKLAQQQLEQIEMQKKLVASFEAEAKKAQEELKAHPVGQEKMTYKKFNLYPSDKSVKGASAPSVSK